MNRTIKQVTSKVIDSLLKNPYKKHYEKEYVTLLEQIVYVRDTTNFFDEWMVDFFVEDIIDTAEPLLKDYKTLSTDGKKCAQYMLKHYIYWYYNTGKKDEGDVLKYKSELKAKIKYEPKYIEKLVSPNTTNVNTEEIGKTFEMAICKLFNTPYNGKYKYSEEDAEKMKNRISGLKDIFSSCEHIGKQDKYDFKTNIGYLSAKTTKSSDKICPQVIGQPSKNNFCKYFKLPLTSTNNDIKKYIVENTTSLLEEYVENTFHCSLVYYDTLKDKVLYINKKRDLVWDNNKLTFSRSLEDWNESSTLKYDGKTIGEFQVHNNRSGIKFRWNLGYLLDKFKDNFEVIKF